LVEKNKIQIVLTGDIIASRQSYEDEDWKSIKSVIDDINERYSYHLLVPMMIYAGDSVGAVINNLENAYEIGIELYEALLPVTLRFNIVEGEIEYGMESRNFGLLQGEALWTSNKLLRELEKTYKTFSMDTGNERLDETVSHMTNMIHNVKSSWSEGQLRIAQSYRHLKKQSDVARELDMSQQYVSKALKASSYHLVHENETYIKAILREWS